MNAWADIRREKYDDETAATAATVKQQLLLEEIEARIGINNTNLGPWKSLKTRVRSAQMYRFEAAPVILSTCSLIR